MSSRVRDALQPADRNALPPALVEAWRAETVDAQRMQRAYLRFRSPAAPRPAARVARWVALGIVIGMSSVYAASSARRLIGSSAPVIQPASPPEPRDRAAAAPRARAAPASESSVPSAAPLVPAPEAAPHLPTPAAVPSGEQWRRAARGLREGDFDKASAALGELTRRGSDTDRESALLVQAQMLLAQGKEAEANDLLRSLRASARTPSVRRKSAELLSRAIKLPSQRSFEPAPGTKLP